MENDTDSSYIITSLCKNSNIKYMVKYWIMEVPSIIIDETAAVENADEPEVEAPTQVAEKSGADIESPVPKPKDSSANNNNVTENNVTSSNNVIKAPTATKPSPGSIKRSRSHELLNVSDEVIINIVLYRVTDIENHSPKCCSPCHLPIRLARYYGPASIYLYNL